MVSINTRDTAGIRMLQKEEVEVRILTLYLNTTPPRLLQTMWFCWLHEISQNEEHRQSEAWWMALSGLGV